MHARPRPGGALAGDVQNAPYMASMTCSPIVGTTAGLGFLGLFDA